MKLFFKWGLETCHNIDVTKQWRVAWNVCKEVDQATPEQPESGGLCTVCENSVDFLRLYARRKTFRRGHARTPRGSAELPPEKISSELRRTSGGLCRTRPDPRQSVRTPLRTGGVVRSKNVRQKSFQKLLSPRTFFRRRSSADG